MKQPALTDRTQSAPDHCSLGRPARSTQTGPMSDRPESTELSYGGRVFVGVNTEVPCVLSRIAIDCLPWLLSPSGGVGMVGGGGGGGGGGGAV